MPGGDAGHFRWAVCGGAVQRSCVAITHVPPQAVGDWAMDFGWKWAKRAVPDAATSRCFADRDQIGVAI
jgi:hypothetical protein